MDTDKEITHGLIIKIEKNTRKIQTKEKTNLPETKNQRLLQTIKTAMSSLYRLFRPFFEFEHFVNKNSSTAIKIFTKETTTLELIFC